MRAGLHLGRCFGIDVIVHWTFVLLIGLLAITQLLAGQAVSVVLASTVLIAAVFICVLLHEFGHALTARAFGIRTHDITLLPIGGLARLERIPEDPWQELWIALAGPAVNVAIVVVLLPIALALGAWQSLLAGELTSANLLIQLVSINVVLVVFNLIPAFPLDGGRVLRAVLALFLPYATATNVAAACGQVMAVMFGIVGFFTNWMLMLIGLFVYFAARGEAQQVQTRSLFRGALVSDAMFRRFRALSPGTPLRAALDELLSNHQRDFPVMAGGKLIGVLHRADLLSAVAQGRRDASVGEVMDRDFQFVEAAMPLDQAFTIIQQTGRSMLPVLNGHDLVGVLTSENVEEWLMVRSALHHRNGGDGREVTPRYADSLPA